LEPRKISGVSSMFILTNSTSGLIGHLTSVNNLPSDLPLWLGAVLIGGYLGVEFGSKKFSEQSIKIALTLVLIMAGAKLMLYN
jgi:uncharacterized membrane protein YfcA